MTSDQPCTSYRFLDHPGPIAFAHRGAHGEVEPNTMAAFAEAVRLGYRYIETDVHATRDGVAVLLHMDRLEPEFDAPGRVGDYTWSELRTLRRPSGEPPVRLDEALSGFPETCFSVEAMTAAAIAPMAEAIARCEALDRICIASMRERWTHQVRGLLGADACWSAGRTGVIQLRLAAWRAPVRSIRFPVALMPARYYGVSFATRRMVAEAHSRGVQVHFWTINDTEQMERLLKLGADGLITDRPRVLKEILQRRGEWPSGS